jgi:hypothetical protein
MIIQASHVRPFHVEERCFQEARASGASVAAISASKLENRMLRGVAAQMFRTFLSLLLTGLLMLGLNVAPVVAAQTTNDAQAVEKVRLKVAKLGLGDKARATVRMKDGTKIKGFVSQAGTNDFTVRDRKTGEPTVILYRDVLKVEDNNGHSTLRNILIGAGIGAAALAVVLVVIFSTLED